MFWNACIIISPTVNMFLRFARALLIAVAIINVIVSFVGPADARQSSVMFHTSPIVFEFQWQSLVGAGFFVILYFLARTNPYSAMMFATGVTSLALLAKILFWVIAPSYDPHWHPDWWFVLALVLQVVFAAAFSIAFTVCKRERAVTRESVAGK